MFSFEHDTLLAGNSMMRFEEYPTDYCGGNRGEIAQAGLSSLAGERFFVPQFGEIVLALHSLPFAPWQHQSERAAWIKAAGTLADAATVVDARVGPTSINMNFLNVSNVLTNILEFKI